jgi:hypothetical protein
MFRVPLIVFLTLLVAISAWTPPVAAQGVSSARIRFVNASPDADPLFGYVDDSRITEEIRTATATGYFQVSPAQAYTFSFRQQNQIVGGAQIEFVIGDRESITLVAYNTRDSLQIAVLRDDTSPIVRGKARVRVFHGVVGVGTMDVLGSGSAGNQNLVSDVPFGAASDDQTVFAGQYDFIASANDEPIATLENLNLSREKRYDIFLIGGTDGRGRAVPFQSDVELPTGTNSIRVGHFSQNAGSISVVINRDPALNLDYGRVSQSLTVAPGEYLVEVFPVGLASGLPLVSRVVTVEAGQSALFTVVDQPESVALRQYEDRYEPVRESSTRWRFLHSASAAARVRLQLADGTPLSDLIGFGEVTEIEVGAGTYELDVVDESGQRLAGIGIQAEANTVDTLILYDAPNGSQSLVRYSIAPGSVIPVRFVYTGEDPITVRVDGERVAELADPYDFVDVTQYNDFLPGSHQITVERNGQTVIDESFVFDTPLTVLLTEVEAVYIRDNLFGIPAGRSRIRVVNTNANTIRWRSAIDRSTIGEPLTQNTASQSFDLEVGEYEYLFTTEIGTTIRTDPLQLDPGTLTTVIIGRSGRVEIVRYTITPRRNPISE